MGKMVFMHYIKILNLRQTDNHIQAHMLIKNMFCGFLVFWVNQCRRIGHKYFLLALLYIVSVFSIFIFLITFFCYL